MIFHIAIGMAIGHEMTHGFDDYGGQYDKAGNKIPWWTNDTVKTFASRKACIIEQYSNYTVSQVNEKVAFCFLFCEKLMYHFYSGPRSTNTGREHC
jgi:predicted metalloendopeptidase